MKTGRKYHWESCSSLKFSKIEITLSEAVKRYGEDGACLRCNPPKLADAATPGPVAGEQTAPGSQIDPPNLDTIDNDTLVEMLTARAEKDEALLNRLRQLFIFRAQVFGDRKDRKRIYHTPNCWVIQEVDSKNRRRFRNEDEAIQGRWLPCPCITGRPPEKPATQSSVGGSGTTKPPVLGQTVYVTKTGNRYHKRGCQYLSQSQIPISLTDARKKYTPCKRCFPQ